MTKDRKSLLIVPTLVVVLLCAVFALAGSCYAFSENVPYGNTGRNAYEHNSRYSGNIIASGVDVSEYQSTYSDWRLAKVGGVDFAILRVTWTGYSKSKFSYGHDDGAFKTNFVNAKANGLMVGAYVFSQAKTEAEAIAEANDAIDRIESCGLTAKSFDLPIYMDYEYAGGSSGRLYGLSDSTATKCAAAFCNQIIARGYKAGVYANTSFFKKINTNALPAGTDLWCAQYYSKCESSKNYSKWQFSSSAMINGLYSSSSNASYKYLGSIDANFWYLKQQAQMTSKDGTQCIAHGATEYNYTGSVVQPKFTVTCGDTVLKEGTDYTIGYVNNLRPGTKQAYAYICGLGNYSGNLLVPFTIGSGYTNYMGLSACKDNGNLIIKGYEAAASPASLEEAESAESEEAEASDVKETESKSTDTKATDGESTLSEGAEEEATLESDKTSDTASGTTDEAALSGNEAEEEPALNEEEGELSEVEANPTHVEYGFVIGESFVRNVPTGLSVAEFLKGIVFIDEEKYAGYSLKVLNDRGAVQGDTVTVATGMLLAVYNDSGRIIGTADITVNGNYVNNNTGYAIPRPLISTALTGYTYYYNGKVHRPAVYVYWNGSCIVANSMSSSSAASIGYSNWNSKTPGTYAVGVTGVTYPGAETQYYSIAVHPTSIYSLSRGKKKFKAKYYKVGKSYVSGYQIKYSLYSNMYKSKTKTISSYKTGSKTVSGLKKKRTYYVAVRTYKKIGKKKYYSSWSGISAVTTK